MNHRPKTMAIAALCLMLAGFASYDLLAPASAMAATVAHSGASFDLHSLASLLPFALGGFTVAELRSKRATLVEELEALTKGEATDETRSAFDGKEADLKKLDEDIKRAERMEEIARQAEEDRLAAERRAADADRQVNRSTINAEIRTIATVSGLDQAWVDGQIDGNATVVQARSAAMDALIARQGKPPVTSHIMQDHTDPAAIRSRMADALVARSTFQAPPEHAREFMTFRAADMLIQLANARGAKLDVRNHIAAVEELFTRSGMHTTSDFPLLLQDAGNKMLLPRYQAAAPSYRAFSSQRSFSDFKDHKFLRLGDFPALQEIKEAGETKYGSVSEKREAITAKEYGAGLSIGRKALINDDLSAFSDFAGMIGVRVAQDENALVYTLLGNNGPTMSDSVALFDAAGHGNKAASGGAIGVTTIGAAVQAMRNQTTLDGIKMSIGPRYLVVGTAKELEGRQLLTAITANDTAKVNPYAGQFELVVDANNAGNRWMMFADPALLPTIVFGYVNGATGPQIRSEIDFDTRALKVAVGLDFACGVIDHRGAYLNGGN